MPLLKENASARVNHEDGESAVEKATAVDGHLSGAADGTVVLIHQDQLFIGHVD
jgi:hypothetical protein